MTQFIPFANPGSYKPNASPVTDPTGYSFLILDDTTYQPTTIAPGNLPGGSLPFVTVASSGGQYTSIGDAIADGKFNMYVLDACTESADVSIAADGDYYISFAPNASDDFSTYQINVANAVTAHIKMLNPTITYAYSASKNFINYTGTGGGNLLVEGARITNNSTASQCFFNDIPSFAGPRQQFVNCKFTLPDYVDGGVQISAGSSMGLEFVSGGASCAGAITASRALINGLQFSGASWDGSGTVGSFTSCEVSGLFVSAETGTPLTRIDVWADSSLSNVVAEGASGIKVVLFSDSVLSNFNLGAIGFFFLGFSSGSCTISNGKTPQGSITTSGGQAKFSNVRFTDGDCTIQAPGSLFTNCDFDASAVISANNVQMCNINCGASGGSTNTVALVSGVENCVVLNANVETAPVDSSGNATNDVSYKLWV
jgi:hypothetical protein